MHTKLYIHKHLLKLFSSLSLKGSGSSQQQVYIQMVLNHMKENDIKVTVSAQGQSLKFIHFMSWKVVTTWFSLYVCVCMHMHNSEWAHESAKKLCACMPYMFVYVNIATLYIVNIFISYFLFKLTDVNLH